MHSYILSLCFIILIIYILFSKILNNIINI